MTTTRAISNARHIEAAELRTAGWTFRQIAERFGWNPDSGATGHAVRHGMQLLNARNGSVSGPNWMLRTFGVEIEHTSVSEYRSAEAMRSAGLHAEETGYTHRVVTWWKNTTDGSCGYECVSPVLSGPQGFADMKTAMTAIRSAGGRVSRSCGLHVHLGMQDMTGEQIARFVQFYADAQNAINQIMPPSRQHNVYCVMPVATEMTRIVREFTDFRQAPQFCSSCGRGRCSHRYRTINVHSFPLYGTVEVRQHQGTLNGPKAEAWVTFLMAMVEIARTDRVSEIDMTSATTLIDTVCDTLNVSATIRRRLLARNGVRV